MSIKQIFCEKIITNKTSVKGIRCINGFNKRDIVLVNKDKKFINKIAKEKQTKKLVRIEKQIDIEDELKNRKCGIYGLHKTPSQKVIGCPKGTTEYKYYYGERCRNIKLINSDNLTKQSLNYPMIICIPNFLKKIIFKEKKIKLTNPKEQYILNKQWLNKK